LDGPCVGLDASSSFDGVHHLHLPHRTYYMPPQVRYRDLKTFIVEPPVECRVAELLDKRMKNERSDYSTWAANLVQNHVYLKPGKQALVCTKKGLTWAADEKVWDDLPPLIPNWSAEDDRWSLFDENHEGFHWELPDDRSVALTYYGGPGAIGGNAWINASTVFM